MPVQSCKKLCAPSCISSTVFVPASLAPVQHSFHTNAGGVTIGAGQTAGRRFGFGQCGMTVLRTMASRNKGEAHAQLRIPGYIHLSPTRNAPGVLATNRTPLVPAIMKYTSSLT